MSREFGRRPRRHPAVVTVDRLVDALDTWPDAFGDSGRAAIERAISVLMSTVPYVDRPGFDGKEKP